MLLCFCKDKRRLHLSDECVKMFRRGMAKMLVYLHDDKNGHLDTWTILKDKTTKLIFTNEHKSVN